MLSTIFLPLVRLAIFTALVRGGFLWLEQSHQIYVDRWIATMIGSIESMAVQAPAWVGWTLAGGLGLVGVTIWELIKYRRQRIKVGGPASKQATEKVFIRAAGTTGLRLINNIFRGDRTHVDARGATNFEAVDNVHLEAERPRAMRLSDALYWIIDNSVWVSEHGRDMFLSQAAIALRQAARDEEITVRGRREIDRHGPGDSFDRTWEDIEPGYWRTHEFELTAVMCAEPHYATYETQVVSSGDITAASMPHYAMLRVWNDELERRWPVANI